MKKIIFILLMLVSSFIYSQKERSTHLGQVTIDELKMKFYDKDSTANALVLYEQGNYYRDKLKKFKFSTDYYKRIKIFNKEAFEKTTVAIYTYKEEIVTDIKAVTYNLSDINSKKETYLAEDQIFTTQETKDYKKTTFTLPNVKAGSVIEYTYKVSSYYYRIKDWYFQSDIPKLESRFDLAILGNYRYNTRLIGFLDLDRNDKSVKKMCLERAEGGMAACASYSFGMKNIPAFKTEDHMLSAKNYLAKISLDLKSIITLTETGVGYTKGVSKEVQNITETWKGAEKSLRLDFLNNQGSKKKIFKKRLPEEIFDEEDQLKKAKKIYSFIQDHYTWNEKNWISSDIHIKKNFANRTGSVAEINLSLYNSLQAAKIESYITLVSTRDNGIPTKLFPVINDFNYIVIKVVIDGKDYFLDATDKYLPFGLVPFKCLNGEARVFDFKKGSYWQNINSGVISSLKIKSTLTLNTEGRLEAKFNMTSSGYFANDIRNEYNAIGEDKYLDKVETKLTDFEIDDYAINYNNDLEKPIKETFTLTSDANLTSGNIFSLKPILNSRVSVNPFKLKERLYPVDFGYGRSIVQRISFEIPEGYKVTRLPEKVVLKLPNNGGLYLFRIQKKDNMINLFVNYQITKKVFTPNEYFHLKEFFGKIIKSQEDSIVIEKI